MSKRKDVVKELRTTEKGTTYWYYPDNAKKRDEKLKEARAELRQARKEANCSEQWNSIETKVNVIKLDSKSDEHYLRYVERKKALREEYGRWTQMKRPEWLEYYHRLSELLFNDADFLHYFKETKKLFEDKMLDIKYEKMREKEDEYDGHLDEYDWK